MRFFNKRASAPSLPGAEMWMKVENSEYLTTIRDALILTLPVIIVGAVGVVLNNFPIPAYQNFMLGIFGDEWRAFGDYVQDGTLAILSVVMIYSIGHRFAERHNAKFPLISINPVIASLVAFCSLCAIIEPIRASEGSSIPYHWVGVHGLFLAIVIGTLASKMFLTIYEMRIFRVKFFTADAGEALSDSLSSMIPAILTIGAFALFKTYMQSEGIGDIHKLFYDFIYLPFRGMKNNLFSASVFLFVRQSLWFLGVHGSNAMELIQNEVFPHDGVSVLNKTFFDTYGTMGGAGGTLSLLIALFTTRRRGGMMKIAQLSLLPAIFNINEPLVFGLPIVLNPLLFIPFTLTPIVLVAIAYYATVFGLVPFSGEEIAWTTPAFISGYAAAGSLAGSILQAVCLAVGFFIYLPFVYETARMQRRKFEHTYNALLEISYTADTGTALIALPGENGQLARRLANDLMTSINKNELFMEYQPQVDGLTGQICGAESLLRWNHPQMGRIPPTLFIRLAEETGFIGEIGLWVCGTSCRQAKKWADHGLTDVVMSFNVSVHQLDDTDLPSKIGDMIRSTGVEPSMMKVEVTESAGLSSNNDQNLLIGELRDMGFKIAIDDFGMGHTSLVYLKQFPVSMIKLDGSIVKDITTDAASAEIVSSISELCRSMNIDLIAEFVETEEQAKLLKSLGCHLYQGYLYSPPVSPDKFTALCEKGFERI